MEEDDPTSVAGAPTPATPESTISVVRIATVMIAPYIPVMSAPLSKAGPCAA
jgi:hypothetical protein